MAFPRPRFDIADIVRRHRPTLEQQAKVSAAQKRVLTDISQCRTAALGGHLEVCVQCGREHPVYNSCRNRHCPKCQAAAQQAWIDARAEKILPLRHFHVVCTQPSELRALTQRYPAEMHSVFLQAVSETLLELGETHYKATMGLTMVLHTWTRDLYFHPHVHVLVTAGGLSLDENRFVYIRRSKRRKYYLFPLKVIGKLLRGKVLDALRKMFAKGTFPGLGQADFNQMMTEAAAHKHWIVYTKSPFYKSEHVLSYLGRYTHRVGISNSRLVDVSENHVTFSTKNGNTATLHPVEFLRRFIQHVLPKGFRKIRHGGLYAKAKPGGALEKARRLVPRPTGTKKAPVLERNDRCPDCGGLLLKVRLLPIPARSPPKETLCA